MHTLPILLLVALIAASLRADVTVRQFEVLPPSPAMIPALDDITITGFLTKNQDISFDARLVVDGQEVVPFPLTQSVVPDAFDPTRDAFTVEIGLPATVTPGQKVEEIILAILTQDRSRYLWWYRFPIEYTVSDGILLHFNDLTPRSPAALQTRDTILSGTGDTLQVGVRLDTRGQSINLRPELRTFNRPLSGFTISAPSPVSGDTNILVEFERTDPFSERSIFIRLNAQVVGETEEYQIELRAPYWWGDSRMVPNAFFNGSNGRHEIELDYTTRVPEGFRLEATISARNFSGRLDSEFIPPPGILSGTGFYSADFGIIGTEPWALTGGTLRALTVDDDPFTGGVLQITEFFLRPPWYPEGSRVSILPPTGVARPAYLAPSRVDSRTDPPRPDLISRTRPRLEGQIPIGQPIEMKTDFRNISSAFGLLQSFNISVQAALDGVVLNDTLINSPITYSPTFRLNALDTLDRTTRIRFNEPGQMTDIAIRARNTNNAADKFTIYFPAAVEAVGPEPAKVIAVRESLGQHVIDFEGAFGTNYYVERSLSGRDGSWVTVAGPFRGRGDEVAFSFRRFPPPDATDRTFYRLVGYAPVLTPVITPVFP